MKKYRITSTDIWSGDVEIVYWGLSKEQAERLAVDVNHEYNNNDEGDTYQICIEEEDNEEDQWIQHDIDEVRRLTWLGR